jgi:hypothetical protein
MCSGRSLTGLQLLLPRTPTDRLRLVFMRFAIEATPSSP